MGTLARAVIIGAVVAVAAAVIGIQPAGAVSTQVFNTCDDARAAGYSNISIGQPGYSQALDRDGDGIACGDDEGAAAAPAVPPIQEPAPEVLGQSVDALPETGVGWSTPFLLAAAVLLVVTGRRFMSAGYEHRNWYPGRQDEVRFTVDSVTRRKRRR